MTSAAEQWAEERFPAKRVATAEEVAEAIEDALHNNLETSWRAFDEDDEGETYLEEQPLNLVVGVVEKALQQFVITRKPTETECPRFGTDPVFPGYPLPNSTMPTETEEEGMSSVDDLIAEAKRFDTAPAEYASRLRGAHDLIGRLADALSVAHTVIEEVADQVYGTSWLDQDGDEQ